MTGEEFEKWQTAQEAYESGVRDGQGEIVGYLIKSLIFAAFIVATAVAWQMWG